jgi:hypothetical protein
VIQGFNDIVVGPAVNMSNAVKLGFFKSTLDTKIIEPCSFHGMQMKINGKMLLECYIDIVLIVQ